MTKKNEKNIPLTSSGLFDRLDVRMMKDKMLGYFDGQQLNKLKLVSKFFNKIINEKTQEDFDKLYQAALNKDKGPEALSLLKNEAYNKYLNSDNIYMLANRHKEVRHYVINNTELYGKLETHYKKFLKEMACRDASPSIEATKFTYRT